MAKEILVIPEQHLINVMAVIKDGLAAQGTKCSPVVREMLEQWLLDETNYVLRLQRVSLGEDGYFTA